MAPHGQEWEGGQGLEQKQQRDGYGMKGELVRVPEKQRGAPALSTLVFAHVVPCACPVPLAGDTSSFLSASATWTHPQGPAPVHLLFEAVHHLAPRREQSEENKRTGHPGSLPRGGVARKSVSSEAMSPRVRYHLCGPSPTHPRYIDLTLALKSTYPCI